MVRSFKLELGKKQLFHFVYAFLWTGWEFLGHNGQWVTFMSELRIYPELGFGTFSVNNGPTHIGNVPYNHRYLHNSIFAIINGKDFSILGFISKGVT